MEIKIDVDGATQLSRNLRVFTQKLGNMQPFYKDAIDIIHNRSDKIFSAQGKNVQKGPKRQPLAASTQRARQNRWGHYKKSPSRPGVLRWTGRLQDDVTKSSTSQKGTIQRNAPYAAYHQRGGGVLPKRPLVDLDNQTNAEIVRSLQKKINDDQKIFGLQI